jgi:hypothetical protein
MWYSIRLAAAARHFRLQRNMSVTGLERRFSIAITLRNGSRNFSPSPLGTLPTSFLHHSFSNMKITKITFYGGGREKICRLGLSDLFLELQEIILRTPVVLEESAKANGAAGVREALDASFVGANDWVGIKAGGIDWVKRMRYNQTFLARLGVEIQVSARSDLLIRDVVHLRNSLQKAEIDVGVIVGISRWSLRKRPPFRSSSLESNTTLRGRLCQRRRRTSGQERDNFISRLHSCSAMSYLLNPNLSREA